MMKTINAEHIADEIISLYKEKGKANYSGEPVTQLEHASQAAQLAETAGESDEVILAAFLHDIGHLLDDVPETEMMDGYGVMNHEEVGKQYLLLRRFSETVCNLVVSHVQAKRYLCAVNTRYYSNLSEASKKTLEYQGGVMSENEVTEFDANPMKNIIIKLRAWDEEAKKGNVPLLDIEDMKIRIVRHLNRRVS